MLYRGFQIEVVSACLSQRWNQRNGTHDMCPSVVCQVFDQYDDSQIEYLESFTLSDGYEIADLTLEQIEQGIRDHVDKYEMYLNRMRSEMFAERKDTLIGRLASRLGESLEPGELYDLLAENVGMTDEEIRACGYQSLSPFFNRPAYAQTIAEYMIHIGTEETTTGNWHFGFDTLNRRFGLKLQDDTEMVEMIRGELYKQPGIVADVDIYDNDFDLLFYTEFCPLVDEDEPIYDQQL